MFADNVQPNPDSKELLELAKAGEKIINDLKALKRSGRMTVAQSNVYKEMLKLYNRV